MFQCSHHIIGQDRPTSAMIPLTFSKARESVCVCVCIYSWIGDVM